MKSFNPIIDQDLVLFEYKIKEFEKLSKDLDNAFSFAFKQAHRLS